MRLDGSSSQAAERARRAARVPPSLSGTAHPSLACASQCSTSDSTRTRVASRAAPTRAFVSSTATPSNRLTGAVRALATPASVPTQLSRRQHPLRLRGADFPNGGIGIVEMLFRCNILALVGGGRNPRYPPNKVMIWDDHQNRCIGELSFRSEVKAVRMSRERVVVVLEYKIYVYNFADLNLLHTIETISNPRGLCALCADSRSCVLACSGLQKGHVRIELFDITRTTLVAAHESTLSCLALNLDGTRLATASQRGTLVRLWDTRSGQRLQEVRRGARQRQVRGRRIGLLQRGERSGRRDDTAQAE